MNSILPHCAVLCCTVVVSYMYIEGRLPLVVSVEEH